MYNQTMRTLVFVLFLLLIHTARASTDASLVAAIPSADALITIVSYKFPIEDVAFLKQKLRNDLDRPLFEHAAGEKLFVAGINDAFEMRDQGRTVLHRGHLLKLQDGLSLENHVSLFTKRLRGTASLFFPRARAADKNIDSSHERSAVIATSILATIAGSKSLSGLPGIEALAPIARESLELTSKMEKRISRIECSYGKTDLLRSSYNGAKIVFSSGETLSIRHPLSKAQMKIVEGRSKDRPALSLKAQFIINEQLRTGFCYAPHEHQADTLALFKKAQSQSGSAGGTSDTKVAH